MLKVLAAAAAGVMVACASATASPGSTPSGVQGSATSPAADLRVHMRLLFGEHVFVLAKLSAAAAAGRKQEFGSYASLLATNGEDLTVQFTAALGQTGGDDFGRLWTEADSLFVDYVVGSVTQNQAQKDKASARLGQTYVPDMVSLLGSALQMPADRSSELAVGQVAGETLVIDDAVAAKPNLYADLHTVYTTELNAGDVLAIAMASKFADKFPGDATSPASKFRSQLDGLLQEHSYLLTIVSAKASQSSANSQLAVSSRAIADLIGARFGSAAGEQARQLWTAQDAALLTYARAASDSDRKQALAVLHNASAIEMAAFLSKQLHATVDVQSELETLVRVIDDQRAGTFPALADDDRTAAQLMVQAGDDISAAPRA